MADVNLLKSIYTSTTVTAIGELAAADQAVVPGTAKIGSLAGVLFGTAGVVSALSVANRMKVGSTSHDISVTGTQAITGVGFQPGVVIILASVAASALVSIGIDNATTHLCVANAYSYIAGLWYPQNFVIYLIVDGTTDARAIVSSMDADGFTLTWTKEASPTGTATVAYLALR